MPFKSEAQKRACYAKNDPNWDCDAYARHGDGYKREANGGKRMKGAAKRRRPRTNQD